MLHIESHVGSSFLFALDRWCSIVFWELWFLMRNQAALQIIVPIYVMGYFLFAFIIFSLSFMNLNIMCMGLVFFAFILCGVLTAVYLCLAPHLCFLLLCLQIFFHTSLFLPSFWDLNMNIRSFWYCLRGTETLSFLLSLPPLCCRNWVNSVDLFASSQILFSVIFIVLFRSSSEFSISDVLFLSSKILIKKNCVCFPDKNIYLSIHSVYLYLFEHDYNSCLKIIEKKLIPG